MLICMRKRATPPCMGGCIQVYITKYAPPGYLCGERHGNLVLSSYPLLPYDV